LKAPVHGHWGHYKCWRQKIKENNKENWCRLKRINTAKPAKNAFCLLGPSFRPRFQHILAELSAVDGQQPHAVPQLKHVRQGSCRYPFHK
jgi:hypothetical protein